MGMPVFNGEPYLELALASLLAQTYENFELIISDNASTDRTESICRDYANRDARIRYYRNDTNIGLSRNQNRVIALSQGKYFLLAHHDDIRAPEYLERTLQILEADESVVICYTQTQDIDEKGKPMQREEPMLQVDSLNLRQRFQDIIRMDHICEPDFGLTRLETLKATGLHGNYADSDRVLLAELILRGRFYRLSDCLFFRRSHALQSTATAPNRQARTLLFAPELSGKLLFPHFRQFKEYLGTIRRAPIPFIDKSWCLAKMLHWLLTNRRRLLSDVEIAGIQVVRPFYRYLFRPGIDHD